jgi:hypothetical protein
MPGLVHADAAAAGQRDRRDAAPRRYFHLGAENIFRFQCSDHGVEIVAQQVKNCAEQLVSGMTLRELTLQRMDSGFCWRHAEDEPAFTGINAGEIEDIAEEGTIGVGVFAVEQKVSTDNHARSIFRNGRGVFELQIALSSREVHQIGNQSEQKWQQEKPLKQPSNDVFGICGDSVRGSKA